MILVRDIRLPLSAGEPQAFEKALHLARIPRSKAAHLGVARLSVDARHGQPKLVYTIAVTLKDEGEESAYAGASPCVAIRGKTDFSVQNGTQRLPHRPVVCGLGPAGLFAALLLARQGYKPIVLERGPALDERVKAVEHFSATGELDPNANIQFGEGGAGTFSDGKLTTRIGDELCGFVTEVFLQHGAPAEIAWKQKPHVGTDLLRGVITSIRREIEALGGEVHFNTALTGFEQKNGRLTGIFTTGGTFPCEALVFAVGHSARDTFGMLMDSGLVLECKPFSVGFRAEHLQSEIEKSDPPTLFQVNGPVGLANWKDYCYDLKDADITKHLTSDSFALKEGDTVYGVAYVIETYGLIANTKLLEKAGYKASDITNFETLKKVADDIQARKDELGVDGAFTSAGMDGSSDWRFKTHLANMPIYYEYKADGIGSTEAIKGTYLDNYKAIWDLYITDSTCDPKLLASKTGNDAVAEFVGEKAVFYQNGTWAWNDVSSLGAENVTMLPIYIGAEGEENQGLCTGTENYWCVNGTADQEDIDATLAFMNWVITSDEGRKSMSQDMGFVTPFDTFTGEYQSANPFVQIDAQYTAEGKTPVSWNFATIPSEAWKDGVGSALTAYAAGTGDWDAVKTAFVDGWATEYQLSH